MSDEKHQWPLPPEQETPFPPPIEQMASDMAKALIQLAWDTGYQMCRLERLLDASNLEQYGRAAVTLEDIVEQREALRAMVERALCGQSHELIETWWKEHNNVYGA